MLARCLPRLMPGPCAGVGGEKVALVWTLHKHIMWSQKKQYSSNDSFLSWAFISSLLVSQAGKSRLFSNGVQWVFKGIQNWRWWWVARTKCRESRVWDMRVMMPGCAWPACHYVITRPGATSAQHRGLICYNYKARQNTLLSIWREERGDHKPQCLERILLSIE